MKTLRRMKEKPSTTHPQKTKQNKTKQNQQPTNNPKTSQTLLPSLLPSCLPSLSKTAAWMFHRLCEFGRFHLQDNKGCHVATFTAVYHIDIRPSSSQGSCYLLPFMGILLLPARGDRARPTDALPPSAPPQSAVAPWLWS